VSSEIAAERKIALELMRSRGALVTTLESAMFSAMGDAATFENFSVALKTCIVPNRKERSGLLLD
jgi:hypothetical protein